MFEVGDRVIINPILKNKYWYDYETYTVKTSYESDSAVKLNKWIDGFGDYIFVKYLILDKTYYRKEKLLKIKNKIKQYGI